MLLNGPERPSSDLEQARRRRLAEVFGEVLPEQTADDRDRVDPGEQSRSDDEWLRAQVPPHHGG